MSFFVEAQRITKTQYAKTLKFGEYILQIL